MESQPESQRCQEYHTTIRHLIDLRRDNKTNFLERTMAYALLRRVEKLHERRCVPESSKYKGER